MPHLLAVPHPGETIREDVLEPLGLSVNQMAKALGVTAARLNEIVRGRRGITADTALRLSRYLGTSAEFWMGLQVEYDLRTTRQARQKQIDRAILCAVNRDGLTDLILTHGEVKAQRAAVFGATVSDMTPDGLWPSDHAGVAVQLVLPGR